jgi:hypothetical protein
VCVLCEGVSGGKGVDELADELRREPENLISMRLIIGEVRCLKERERR